MLIWILWFLSFCSSKYSQIYSIRLAIYEFLMISSEKKKMIFWAVTYRLPKDMLINWTISYMVLLICLFWITSSSSFEYNFIQIRDFRVARALDLDVLLFMHTIIQNKNDDNTKDILDSNLAKSVKEKSVRKWVLVTIALLALNIIHLSGKHRNC